MLGKKAKEASKVSEIAKVLGLEYCPLAKSMAEDFEESEGKFDANGDLAALKATLENPTFQALLSCAWTMEGTYQGQQVSINQVHRGSDPVSVSTQFHYEVKDLFPSNIRVESAPFFNKKAAASKRFKLGNKQLDKSFFFSADNQHTAKSLLNAPHLLETLSDLTKGPNIQLTQNKITFEDPGSKIDLDYYKEKLSTFGRYVQRLQQ